MPTVGTIEDLAARVERIETHLELQRLAADYCIGADQQDLFRFRAVWTEDAVWDAAGDDPDHDEQRFRGIEAITTAVEAQWAAFPRMQHATANHVVDLDPDSPDSATGQCDVIATVQLPDGRWVVGGGVYQDVYRREGRVWRIASRLVVRAFDLEPLPGHHGVFHT